MYVFPLIVVLAVIADVVPVVPTPLPVKMVTAFPLPSVFTDAADKLPLVKAKLTVTPLIAVPALFFTFAVITLLELLAVNAAGAALTVTVKADAVVDAVRVMMIDLVEPLPRVARTISSTCVPEPFVPALYVVDMSVPMVVDALSCIGIVIVETLAPLESMKLAPLLFTGMVKVIV